MTCAAFCNQLCNKNNLQIENLISLNSGLAARLNICGAHVESTLVVVSLDSQLMQFLLTAVLPLLKFVLWFGHFAAPWSYCWNMIVKSFHSQLVPTNMKEFMGESTTGSWQAPWVFTQLPKTSKLLFTFILASSCKLAFAASHSKSYPVILFLQFWVGVQSRSGSQGRFGFPVSLFWAVFVTPPASPEPVGACCLSLLNVSL